MAAERWKLVHEDSGWSVFRNNRIVQYDCATSTEAMRVVKRKATPGSTLTVEDDGEVTRVRL